MRCPQCQSEFKTGTRCPFDGAELVGDGAWSKAKPKADPYVGHVIDDRYRIIERLGEGSMAVVFRAEDVKTRDSVAIKILKPTRDDDLVERFRREAQLVSRLQSPHTVRLHGFGEQGSTLYLAMEQLDGRGLDAELERGPLSPRRTLTVLREVCAALDEAHGLGMVHRDLKPANIFMTKGGTVKVLDFGIAKVVTKTASNSTIGMMALSQPLTQMGAVMGTPTYMAPEQARDEALDARTDLYALGVVAYHCITGHPPFTGAPGEVIFLHTHKAPPPLPPEVDPRIAALVMRLLEKDPAQRPSSAAALTREIDDVLGSAPARGTSLPAEEAPPRWGLRIAVVSAAAVILAAAAVTAQRLVDRAPVAVPPPPGLVDVPLETP